MSGKNTISCIAVDDEPLALNVVQRHIALIPTLQLEAVCNNAVEALEFLHRNPVDLIFLDIKMPHMLGTQLVRSLRNPPKVIFTSAYRKFAIEGFDLNAVDYLLKPISFDRFLKAVSKVLDQTLRVAGHDPAQPPKTDSLEAFLYFRSDRKMVKVGLDEILCVESIKDYVRVFTPSRTIITKQSISSLEDMLPKDNFIRVHRSFIVSVNKIQSFNNEAIEVGGKEIPISRMYRQTVRNTLNVAG
jgi:DNA-binding LytR/AlgR family response regulator